MPYFVGFFLRFYEISNSLRFCLCCVSLRSLGPQKRSVQKIRNYPPPPSPSNALVPIAAPASFPPSLIFFLLDDSPVQRRNQDKQRQPLCREIQRTDGDLKSQVVSRNSFDPESMVANWAFLCQLQNSGKPTVGSLYFTTHVPVVVA